jgi:hypothetical protein
MISRAFSYLNPLAYLYPSAEDLDFGDEGLPLLMGGAGLPEGLRLPPLGEAHEVAPLVLPPADPAVVVVPPAADAAPDAGVPVALAPDAPAPDAVVVALPDAAPDAGVPVAPAVAPTFLQKVATKIVACWNKVMYREVPVVPVRVLTPEQERRQTMVNNISVMVMNALLFKLCGKRYNHDIVKIIATRVANEESFYDVFLEQHPDLTFLQEVQVKFFISRYFYSQELLQKTIGGLLETLCPNIDGLRDPAVFDRKFLGVLEFFNGLMTVQRQGRQSFLDNQDGTNFKQHVATSVREWREFRNRPKVVGDFVNKMCSFVPTSYTYFDYFTSSNYRFVYYFGVAAECVLGKTIGKIFSKSISHLLRDQIKNYLKSIDGNDVVFHLRFEPNRRVIKNLVLDFTDSLKVGLGMAPTVPVVPPRPEDLPPEAPVGASSVELRRQLRTLIWQVHALLSVERLPDDELSRESVARTRDAARIEKEKLEEAMNFLRINLEASELIDPYLQRIRSRLNSDWITRIVNRHFISGHQEPLEERELILVEQEVKQVISRSLDRQVARRLRPVVVALGCASSAASRAQRLWGWVRRDRSPARPELGRLEILNYRETLARRGAHLAVSAVSNWSTRHVEVWDAIISGGIGVLDRLVTPPAAAPVA